MSRTGYTGVQWRPGELAVGYAAGGRRDGTPVEQGWAPDGPWWNLRGNGGVLSTVGDLFRWHQALEGDAVLSAEAKAKMWTPHVPEDEGGRSHYGYGWAIQPTQRGTRLISHNGGNGIFFADFRRYVDEGVVVLVMSNAADQSAERTLTAVARTVFGGEVSAPPAAVAGDPARAGAAAGTYALPGGGGVRVAADGARLRIAPEGQEAYALLGGGASTPELAALGERSAAMLRAAAAGDFAPMHQAFGGEMPVEELRGTFGGFLAGLAERLGAVQSVEAVGTARQGPVARTVVRLRMERGTQHVRIAWEDGRVAGMQPMGEVPPVLFVPVGADAWASYDQASGTSVRVRMENGALVIETPAGPVRATRAG